tara:strand:+ start:41869 stop:42309 length:441 start_codon:yes stop_codon:yes gene_type:complete
MSQTLTVASDLEVDQLVFSSDKPWYSVDAPKVLIIEDDRDVHQGWSVFLRHQGYEVLSAHNGVDGLDAIIANEPDIVLLDLNLPGMHGSKVLHEIRMRRLPVHVVVVTASDSPATGARATQRGASLVMNKPVSPHELVSVIGRILD